MDICLCMIVKNEENNLKKCLENSARFFDEIVVVDTGSNDSTIKVAKEYTEKVFNILWKDDFAYARNYAISKASLDWILMLDADEFIIECNVNGLRDFIENNIHKVGRIKRINYIDRGKGIQKNAELVNRLFNKKYFEYEGIIHEQIVSTDKSSFETQPVEIIVDHIGYMQKAVVDTRKIERNITLLKKALEEKPDDPYLYFQMGKAYYMGKVYDDAACYFEKALEYELNFKLEYVVDLVTTYGYSLLNALRFEDSLKLEKYGVFYSDLIDFRFLMGHVYMNNGMLDKALKSFFGCIGSIEGKMEGVNSYLPSYNIAVIYECLGFLEDAVDFYKMCSNYGPALLRLKMLSGACNEHL
ncbi:glycosyltransferase [Acetivibrio cellulolyticus]|uniref:glycosyltransferase n=1 Tax=Acetivibrio cellulolyticus TaxID=35830 RepID=UPI0001E2E34A|nr:glycosyltransferase [Acetivibrio cellulolyticus]